MELKARIAFARLRFRLTDAKSPSRSSSRLIISHWPTFYEQVTGVKVLFFVFPS
jgi:hypothetical protein